MKLLFSLQMPWLEVDLNTVIPCLEVSLLLTCAGSNVFRTSLLELLLIPPSTYISHTYHSVRKSLYWFPIIHRSVFKTALLVYKFIHSAYQKYFEPLLKPRYSVYRTGRSQSDGVLLKVPHFASIYMSKKHFGLSFAYDAPRIWNDFPDDVRSATYPP